jgi:hypothetical protein
MLLSVRNLIMPAAAAEAEEAAVVCCDTNRQCHNDKRQF